MFSTVIVSPFNFYSKSLTNLFYQFASRSQSFYFGRDASDYLRESVAFGCGNPREHCSVAFHADIRQKALQSGKLPARH
jgi:hypothetical protein